MFELAWHAQDVAVDADEAMMRGQSYHDGSQYVTVCPRSSICYRSVTIVVLPHKSDNAYIAFGSVHHEPVNCIALFLQVILPHVILNIAIICVTIWLLVVSTTFKLLFYYKKKIRTPVNQKYYTFFFWGSNSHASVCKWQASTKSIGCRVSYQDILCEPYDEPDLWLLP